MDRFKNNRPDSSLEALEIPKKVTASKPAEEASPSSRPSTPKKLLASSPSRTMYTFKNQSRGSAPSPSTSASKTGTATAADLDASATALNVRKSLENLQVGSTLTLTADPEFVDEVLSGTPHDSPRALELPLSTKGKERPYVPNLASSRSLTDFDDIDIIIPTPSISSKQTTGISSISSYVLNPLKSRSTASVDQIITTRPKHLPPKSTAEQKKHLQEHNEIMKQARKRERDEERRKLKLEDKRLRREKRMNDSRKIWKEKIIPRWSKCKDDASTRELWSQGIHPDVRGQVWKLSLRNELCLSRNVFDSLDERAKAILLKPKQDREERELESPSAQDIIAKQERSLRDSLDMIQLDVSRTFPLLGFFQDHGPLRQSLVQVLQAIAIYRPDLGYVQGMSFHAAMFLVAMDTVPDAFICLANLFSKPFFTSFFMLDFMKISRYFRVFKMFFGEFLPDLYLHFVTLSIDCHIFLIEWFLAMYSRSLPFQIANRVWDCYFLHGESFIFKTGIGILKYLQSSLLANDYDFIVHKLTHLSGGGGEDLDEDELFGCIQSVDISEEKYFVLLTGLSSSTSLDDRHNKSDIT